ncbi:MAG: hypothetical protein WC977_10095 [Anaerovoracaceae bacterium]|jgi:hypothetical protein
MATDKLAKTEIQVMSLAQVQEAMSYLDGEEFGVFDFPELSVPSGGGTTWTVPTADGEEETKTLDCILMVIQKVRQYYPGEFTGESIPPQCASPDGKVGIGNPGGECATCQFSQWGSDTNNSQACSERRHVLLLLPHSVLPYFLNVPPSSIKALKRYALQLAGSGRPYFSVRTQITLEKTKNATGIDYSACIFKQGEALDETAQTSVAGMREALQGMLTQYALRPTQATVAQPPAGINVDDFMTNAPDA